MTNSKKHNSIRQFITYTLVGCSNTIIDFIVMNLLWFMSDMYLGNINYIFKAISFSIYSTTGYLLNKKYTFNTTKNNKSPYIQYVSLAGIITIVDTILIAKITQYQIFDISDALWANIVNLGVCAVIGFIGFLINKYIIFNNNSTNNKKIRKHRKHKFFKRKNAA